MKAAIMAGSEEAKRNQLSNARKVDRVLVSFGKYNLTVRSFTCVLGTDENYRYELHAARRNSGLRGGHLRNDKRWTFRNLNTTHREIIGKMPMQIESK